VVDHLALSDILSYCVRLHWAERWPNPHSRVPILYVTLHYVLQGRRTYSTKTGDLVDKKHILE